MTDTFHDRWFLFIHYLYLQLKELVEGLDWFSAVESLMLFQSLVLGIHIQVLGKLHNKYFTYWAIALAQNTEKPHSLFMESEDNKGLIIIAG